MLNQRYVEEKREKSENEIVQDQQMKRAMMKVGAQKKKDKVLNHF